MISRRRFVADVTLGVLAAPTMGQAQPPAKIPRVGLLYVASAEVAAGAVKDTEEAFRELGYVLGKTIILEARFAGGRPERLRQLAAELVKLPADVIIAANNTTIAAAREATSLIPIVMVASVDPVRAGFVQNLARPGTNITGLTAVAAPETMAGKLFSLLKEMLPGLSRIAVLWNPAVPASRDYQESREAHTRRLGIGLESLEISESTSLDPVFARARQHGVQAIVVLGDPVTFTRHRKIAAVAIKYRVPALGYHREFVDVGGLMCYGVNVTALSKRSVYYADRILKGAKPGDQPVEQPTVFEMMINLRTARTLGITIPKSLLLRAHRVIDQ